jgi:hypothetical protein
LNTGTGIGRLGRVAWLFGQVAGRRPRRAGARPQGLGGWLRDPRNTVLIVLAAVLLIGGGRKWLRARRARAALGRLEDPRVTPDVVEAAAEHGREALIELFRLLGTADDHRVRDAAGRALAVLWKRDELIPEEEKALVRRAFAVTWRARRRYPRELRGPIPVDVLYGVPFLIPEGSGVEPQNLEWSHRVMGTNRAGLETFSPWRAGPGSGRFLLEPADFTTSGPHRLVLQTKVRTKGLTSAWDFELPHVAFAFELDPNLAVEALLTLPDDARAGAIASAVRLEAAQQSADDPRYLAMNDQLVLRDPPRIAIRTPLPCDLAHAVYLEFEGIPGRFSAGRVVLSGQGENPDQPAGQSVFPLAPIEGLSSSAIDKPGERQIRVILEADPHLGWTEPEVRSIWPGTITTEWVEARINRR